jgi:deoxyribodipyrimidine photo-lyase
MPFNKLKWNYDAKLFDLWCSGTTGCPIVDAGMRELNQTGFMHNRVRMIAASFLVKDLHIDWRLGEKYFAQTLIDYDPAVNNGNWQWVASTGCDAQPYFRIFNPWIQAVKFDPDCLYIKKWIPELKNTSVETIHNWHKQKKASAAYPLPCVDHAQEAKKTLGDYTRCAKL